MAADNKKIAKNTCILYLRMLVTMAIGFYSARVVLEQLGVDGYGVYSVVGGIIVIVAFINSAMTNATQRYINYEKGTGNQENLKKVFSASMTLHIILAVIIGILAEVIGPWILNNYLHIPSDLLIQANYVYQFSVISFLVGIITVPYNAVIIAYERMSLYAISSIVESVLKLASAVSLFYINSDRLSYYALFIFLSTFISRAIYVVYCKLHYVECNHIQLKTDKGLIKELVSFSGWSVVGSFGYIMHTQGIAIVINLFFTAAVNSAQGIANQVNGIVQGFTSNFTVAVNPQIVQTYAAGELEEMHKLLYRSSRLAIFLTSLFIIPLMISCRGILAMWLTTVPDYTIGFVEIVLLIALINSITSILSSAQNATGNIKKYQIVLTLIGLLHIPFTILAYALNGSPLWGAYIYFIITIILQIIRINFVCKAISLDRRHYYQSVVVKSVLAIAMGIIIPLFLSLSVFPSTILYTLFSVFVTLLCVGISYYLIGLQKNERKYIANYIKTKLSHV